MRSEAEIAARIEEYRWRLALAVEEDQCRQTLCADHELLILALVNKLEVLFWVLDIDLPGRDLIDSLPDYYS